MKKTRFLAPYVKTKEGNYKLNIPGLSSNRRQRGVYLIKSLQTGSVIYVGKSNSHLYKTLTRHFQDWNDKRQERFVYSKAGFYSVRVVFTNTDKQTDLLEKALILKLHPRDNKSKVDFFSRNEEFQASKVVTEYEEAPF